MTNGGVLRMIMGMKTKRKLSSTGFTSNSMLCSLALLCLAGFFLVSCASAPQYPVYSTPTTKVLPASYEDVFKSALAVLKRDARLELHTIDKAGRFLAWEKTSGFIFFRHRTILDVELRPEGADATNISMKLTAEDYEMGGFKREAGWYPSSTVDPFLGEDIMGLIEKEVAKSKS